jgi:Fic family protein
MPENRGVPGSSPVSPFGTRPPIIYVPPPVPEMHMALNDFERYLHDDAGLPDLIYVGLAHAQFETNPSVL